MDATNSHLPLGSLRGWLLVTGEGRWKSATKFGLVSKRCSIWMSYLKAEVGGVACSGTFGGRSRPTGSDEEGSCSHLTAGLRCTKICHSASNNVCGTSIKEAVWSVVVGEATGGQLLSSSKVCPRTPKLNLSRRSIIRSC